MSEQPPDLAAFFVWPAGSEDTQEPAVLSTTDDLRISELKELSTPQEVMREIPRTLTATRIVTAARNAIHAILNGSDDRLLVVVGPCSVHDPAAAVEYAERLVALRERLADRLEIVMRVYFEKPRKIGRAHVL